MFDLHIAHLRRNIADVAGHEHRIRPITEHAVALPAERLSKRVEATEQSREQGAGSPLGADGA